MPDLPTVEETFEANVAPFIAAMHEMRDSVLESAAAVEVLQETIDSLHGKTVEINVDTAGGAGAAGFAGMAAEAQRVATGAQDASRQMVVLKQTTEDSGAAAAAAGVRFGALGFGLRLTGTTIHWIVAGSAELLAVGVPALIALGAGLFTASQGAQNAYNHMTALYDTLEAVGPATHQTMGDVLGLGHAFQAAQDAANPGVYELLGSAINDAKTHFADLAGAGLQVVHMFDEFAARVTVDLRGGVGTQLHDLLGGMVTDLQQFGNVLGNLGHALLNFAAAMPGLAHVLLDIAVGISTVVEWASRGGVLITMAMGLEEMYRWGGLAASMLVRLLGLTAAMNAYGSGGFIFRFGAALLALGQGAGAAIGWMGTMVGRLGSLVPAFGEAGAAMEAFGADMKATAAAMSPMAVSASALLVGGMGILAVALDHARNASQRLIDTTNQAVQAAPTMSQAMLALAEGVSKAGYALQAQEQVLQSYPGYLQATGSATGSFVTQLEHLSGPLGGVATGMINVTSHSNIFTRAIGSAVNALVPVTSAFHFFSSGAAQAASQVDQLHAAITRWAGTAATMVTNATTLAGVFHTSLPGAFAMAQEAGVNLMGVWGRNSEAMKIAVQQVRNLITGLGAMGAPAGMVGADMTAMGIQSQLAGTKIQQLNQAWDQWVTSVNNGLGTMAATGLAIGQLGGKAYTLAGDSQRAMTSFRNFSQAIAQGQTALDTLRTGMAEGVVSTHLFGTTVRGLVGEMAPFTQGNKAAVAVLSQLAHQAGGPTTTSLKTLEQWAGVAGNTAKDQFARGMESATAAMGNMSKVAQNLSAVINSQLDTAMASAIAKTLNISGLTQTYTNDLNRYGAQAPQTAHAQAVLNDALQRAYSLGQQAAGALNHTGNAAAAAGNQAAAAAGHVRTLGGAIDALHSKTIYITTFFNSVGSASIPGGGPGGHGGPLPGRQFGGTVQAARPYLVGEAGRELFVPNAPGHVYSNPDTERFMSNATAVGAPAGGGRAEVTVHSHVHLDGQEIFSSVKTQTARYNVRNGNPQSGRLAPGA